MSTFSILSLVFGSIAALATAFLPFAFMSALRDKRDSATTTGTVLEMEAIFDQSWVVHIDYEVDGVHHTLRAGSNGGYTVGETVRVRYVRADPSRSFLAAGGHIWMEAVTALVLAVAFSGASGLFLALDRLSR